MIFTLADFAATGDEGFCCSPLSSSILFCASKNWSSDKSLSWWSDWSTARAWPWATTVGFVGRLDGVKGVQLPLDFGHHRFCGY